MSMPPSMTLFSTSPPRAIATGLDLPANEAELDAIAEGRATASTRTTSLEEDTDHWRHQTDEEYLAAALARLDHSHNETFRTDRTRTVDATPAQLAHPRIQVHGVHGLDPTITSRAEIEAKLESMDQARKIEKKRLEGKLPAATTTSIVNGVAAPPANIEPPDEALMKVLALRKLQLLQLHLKTDNQPILILPASESHGNLYLGSVGASHHLPHLLAHGITHVLSVGRNLAQPFPSHFEYLYIPMLDSSTTRITPDIYETSWQFIETGRTVGRGVNKNNAAVPATVPASALRDGMTTSSPPSGARSLPPQPQPLGEDGMPVAPYSRSNTPPPVVKPGNVLIHCFAGKSRSTTILLSYLMYANRWSLDYAYAHVKKCRPAINPNPGFLLQLKELEAKLVQNRAAGGDGSTAPSRSQTTLNASPIITPATVTAAAARATAVAAQATPPPASVTAARLHLQNLALASALQHPPSQGPHQRRPSSPSPVPSPSHFDIRGGGRGRAGSEGFGQVMPTMSPA